MSQLKTGAILSYLSIVLSIMVALVYTPVMIRLLGQSEFGLYSVLGSLAAYFSVMDMGLGNAIVRFTAKNRVDGDKESEARLNGLFLMLYILIGVLTVILGIVVFHNIDTLFQRNFSVSELAKAKVMVIILTINFSLSFPLSIFNAIIKAYEHFIVDKLLSITRILLAPILILPFIYNGFGAVSMVVITTIVNILCLLFSMYYCFKKLKVRIKLGKIDFGILKQIMTYSFFVFLAVVVDQVNWQTDQIILGAVKGTAVVAVYAIAMQFIKIYIQFSTSISGLFLPKVSMMVAKNATSTDLTTLMIRYGRIQYIIITFILCGFSLFGFSFIEYWAGSDYTEAYYIVLIIMIPLTIPLVQNFGLSILYAMNLQGFRSIVLICIAILNVIISIPVAKIYGGVGVAAVTSMTLIIGNIIAMNIYYSKKIGINIPLFWKSLFKLTLVTLFSLTVGIGINFILPRNEIPILGIKIILFSLFHFFVLFKFGFNVYEKNLCKNAILKVKSIIKR